MGSLVQRLCRVTGALAFVLLLLVAPAQATFPGENGRFSLTADSGVRKLVTMNPDGTGIVEHTNGIAPSGFAQDALASDWSPDGKRLAFATYDRRLDLQRLEVINADGTGRAVILEPGQSGHWLPDGRNLLVGSRMVDAEDGTSTQLSTFDNVPDGLVIGSPEPSPDGTKVAFDGHFEEEFCDYALDPPECWMVDLPREIYVVNVDGSGLTALTSNGRDNWAPDWSPDNSQIVYTGDGEIHTMDAGGGNQTSLGIKGEYPLWSPDDRKIAFMELRTSFHMRPDLYVVDADGSNATKIIEGDSSFTEYRVSSWQAIPNRAPDCTGVTAAPTALWPANKKFRLVKLSGATDPDGDPVTIEITGVTQDEPVGGSRDTQPVGNDSQVRLRSERDARGDGRVYQVAFRASDTRVSCAGTATVRVPRHKSAAAVDSAPPGYDS